MSDPGRETTCSAGGDRAGARAEDHTGGGRRTDLLIIGGGIAAYKSLELIRRLKEAGWPWRCILTAAAQEFITPLSAGALSGEQAFTDLFDARPNSTPAILAARQADLVVVAPATADLMAKMGGHADDLASAVLLATGRTVLVAPAMNPHMWNHPATRRNFARLAADGIAVVGPNSGRWRRRVRPASGAWQSRSKSWQRCCRSRQWT